MEQNNNQETQHRRNPEPNSNHMNVESGSGSDPADSFQDNSHQPSSRLREFALWFHLPTYSTFRYGMITVYVGTLLMVIGYHNPWIAFTRYLRTILYSYHSSQFQGLCSTKNSSDLLQNLAMLLEYEKSM